MMRQLLLLLLLVSIAAAHDMERTDLVQACYDQIFDIRSVSRPGSYISTFVNFRIEAPYCDTLWEVIAKFEAPPFHWYQTDWAEVLDTFYVAFNHPDFYGTIETYFSVSMDQTSPLLDTREVIPYGNVPYSFYSASWAVIPGAGRFVRPYYVNTNFVNQLTALPDSVHYVTERWRILPMVGYYDSLRLETETYGECMFSLYSLEEYDDPTHGWPDPDGGIAVYYPDPPHEWNTPWNYTIDANSLPIPPGLHMVRLASFFDETIRTFEFDFNSGPLVLTADDLARRPSHLIVFGDFGWHYMPLIWFNEWWPGQD